jgi:hypothetical protein
VRKEGLLVHIREVVGSSPSPPIFFHHPGPRRVSCRGLLHYLGSDYAIEGYWLAKRPAIPKSELGMLPGAQLPGHTNRDLMLWGRQSGRTVRLPETAAHAILAAMHKPVRPFKPILASLLITLIYPASGQHATALQDSDQPASHIDSGSTRHTNYYEGVLSTCVTLAGCSQ